MSKVGIVTGTRAEYGLLKPVIRKIHQDNELELMLWVTGAHLSKRLGNTYREIEEDGFPIFAKVDIGLEDACQLKTAFAMSTAMAKFAEQFQQTQPDIVILLGDRYEMMAVACAATMMRIPLAHLYGGETTEGAFDEAFRHCISKMSHLHFTSTEVYRRRVIQLGEQPDQVFHVGALGVENAKSLKLLNRDELEQMLHFQIDSNTLLVTFHPVTLEKDTAGGQVEELLNAILDLQGCKAIFTKANADPEGEEINRKLEEFVRKNSARMVLFDSLGQLRYLSTMRLVGAVVGNSSSGIVEAPSFGVPTVDIGDRQKGRVRAETVIHCEPIRTDIQMAIRQALSLGSTRDVYNPYERDGSTSDQIVQQLKNALKESKISLIKPFYDIK